MQVTKVQQSNKTKTKKADTVTKITLQLRDTIFNRNAVVLRKVKSI